MSNLKIVMASDHAGLALKQHLKPLLEKQGYAVADVGTHTPESTDYPDYAAEAGRRLAKGEFDRGIFICGTGTGIAIAANKIPGIRAAACTHEFLAEMSRRHNDANVLCLGERIVAPGLAEVLVQRFLATEFEGGRHARRVDKVKQLDRC
ncbi:MAG: ribose 5-phosphate isomerase B [Planctomycetota bacterium]|nr:ribose 5-phosphate isomerase B [Planctomycetota bacterium]